MEPSEETEFNPGQFSSPVSYLLKHLDSDSRMSFNEFEDPLNGFTGEAQDDFGLDGGNQLNK